MRTLDREALEDILYGATFLGSGGGGPFSGGRNLVAYLVEQFPDGVSVEDPDAIGPDKWGAAAAGLGSPDAAAGGSTAFTKAPTAAFRALEETIHRKFSYVVPAEVGAMNSLIPLVVAAQNGLPALDGDGAGRAIPELTMSVFTACGVPISPMQLCNEPAKQADSMTRVTLDCRTAAQADQMARSVVSCPIFGQVGGFATWAMDGTVVRRAAIKGTLSMAERVGRGLRSCLTERKDVLAVLREILEERMHLLFHGRLERDGETTGGGFDSGVVTLRADDGRRMTIYNLNENLLAWRSDRAKPVAMGPDSICYVTPDGMPLSNAELNADKIGQDLFVIGVRAYDAMRAPHVVAAFEEALHAMGYAGPYVPIEDLDRE